MKKTDIHLHLTFEQHPKTEHMFVSSAEHMLPHLRRGISGNLFLDVQSR